MHVLRGAVLLGAEVAALGLLIRPDLPSVDWSNVSSWLKTVPPEDAVIALVRVAALATVGYLLASTALYVVASLIRVPALIRGASAITLPSLRCIVDGAVAASFAVAPVSLAFGVTPVAAQQAPAPVSAYAPVPAGDGAPSYEPTPAGGPAPLTSARVRVVQPGDSLWTIATEHLASARNVPPDEIPDGEVAPVWRAIIDLNIPTLDSGDPDLIYPGESIGLPSV